MTRILLAAVVLAGCGGGGAPTGDDAPGDDSPGDDSPGDDEPGPDAMILDDGGTLPDAGFPDVECTGTVTGGLSGTLSSCLTPYVFGYDNGTRWITGITVSLLDGAQLDTGPCSFGYQLATQPTTGTTYTFADVVAGVSNLYEVHATGPMTIWACGTNGTVTYGSGLSLTFTALQLDHEVNGTQVWRAHGHVACRYASSFGEPPVDLTLTF